VNSVICRNVAFAEERFVVEAGGDVKRKYCTALFSLRNEVADFNRLVVEELRASGLFTSDIVAVQVSELLVVRVVQSFRVQ
jgi:hypothetical protein